MGDRNDDSYYLGYIGTKAAARGKGYATKLLKHMMAKVPRNPILLFINTTTNSENADVFAHNRRTRKTAPCISNHPMCATTDSTPNLDLK
jgi:RimJ/RimL family protein N-acetyltransferase